MTDSRPGDLFQPGDLVNNTYRIEAILGRGGTSDVYRARSEISGRLAALKVLKAEFSTNDDYLVLLTREEEIRDIRHDAVVRYSENNRTADGHVYLVMDYVDGPGLDQKLKAGPMSADDLLIVCRRVTQGLQAAHSRSIVHRDLSPDNIILRDGDPAQAVIIDFGIAKDTNPGAETIVGNEFAGKYAYAAPEQLAGRTDHRTDIYSLGALLLANFRGASPNPGRNPMEVVENKSKRLDTEGVPEPLKTVIEKMTAPDPDARFQSTSEVLAALDGAPIAAASTAAVTNQDDDLSDATVVVPRSTTPAPKAEAAATAEPSRVPDPLLSPAPSGGKSKGKTSRAPTAEKKSRAGLMGLLAVAALIVAGAGGYFGGFFDSFLAPSYPVATPYSLVVEHQRDRAPRAVGYAPSEDMRTAMTELMLPVNGNVDLTLASGDIADSWGSDIISVVQKAMALDEWRLSANGNQVALTGSTTDSDLHAALEEQYKAGFPGGLQGDADLELISLFLAADVVQSIADQFADCGPLTVLDPPQTGFGPGSSITIQGALANPDAAATLERTLQTELGNRPITLELDQLNPTLCLIENFLPAAPPSDIDILFANGDNNDAPNDTGVFAVGENPVIDIALPADVTDGNLFVSVFDVSGNVFHLLPNIGRQDNSVAALRDGATGPANIRVAYNIAQSQENGGLAFRIDESTLGKSKVVVIHSLNPVFESMRPTTESATGYAEALRDQSLNQNAQITSLDSRILTSVR